MSLFEMSSGSLEPVPSTTFAAERVLERTHLQRVLRERIDVIDNDLMVVAEEFGDFSGARRRVDLLCIDRAARLVVIELKRTEDGGHMELQALRYAAMVSTMTFEQLVDTYARFLFRVQPEISDEASARLAEWLDDAGGEEVVLDREVRLVLVASDFDREITTTVLWLNDVYGLDIRCIRLSPYKIDHRLLLDVQQLIPLPEAAEFTVQLRRREAEARAMAKGGGRDFTRYVITTPEGESEALPKRRAILELVRALHVAGVPGGQMSSVLPSSKLLDVSGILEGEQLKEVFIKSHPGARNNLHRWFFESPLQEPGTGRTWVFSKMWGTDTVAALDQLLTLAPEPSYGYQPG